MNDNACAVFLNLINLAVRMMPIFLCLEPRQKNRENIAAVSVYLWVVMISMQSLFHMNETQFLLFSGAFSCLFFLVLLIFFDGSLLKKAFLYLSAWLLAALSNSLNAFAAWVLRGAGNLTSLQVGVIVSFLSACGVYLFVRFWLKEVTERLFAQLTSRSCLLLLGYPAAALGIILYGTSTIFSPAVLALRGFQDIIFYLALCVMILILYVMILSSTAGIVTRRKTEEELSFAKKLIDSQRERYNQMLEHMEQVRIIRHDFRHHIHALEHMDLDAQKQYLAYLHREMEETSEEYFCENRAVNGLLQESAAKCRQNGIDFQTELDISSHIPIDDLTLCIVTGNLINNAIEACLKLPAARHISFRARWLENHLLLLVENTYNGHLHLDHETFLSTKPDGGLGLLSVRRILNQPGDEFDIDYNDTMFTAMVKIGVRG
ncbi:MAG: sensor histidine kinase [Hungatella hathewayi]|nr:sensor histidine kinase [Hungatella hathewayi]